MKHIIILAALIALPAHAGVLIPKGTPTQSIKPTIGEAVGTVPQVNPPKRIVRPVDHVSHVSVIL